MKITRKPYKTALRLEFEKAALAGTDINGWLGLLGAQMLIMLGIAIFNFYRILQITGSPNWIYFTREDIKDPKAPWGAPSLFDPLWNTAISFELITNSILIVFLSISAITYFSRSSTFRILVILTMSMFSVACIIDLSLISGIKNYPVKLYTGAIIATVFNITSAIPWCVYVLSSKWCALVYAKDRPSMKSLREEYEQDEADRG
jgi:hypothetical protein